MSRARWLALGSALSGLGCTTAGAPVSAALQPDGAASQASDAAGDVSLDSDEGPTADGSTADDTSTADDAVAASDALADADGGACTPPTGTFACGGNTCTATEYCAQGSGHASCSALPSQCEPCPTCECLGTLACTEDDAGHLTVSVGCYGSPPARPTRFAQA